MGERVAGDYVAKIIRLCAVASVKLTERGRPQVILADGSAYVLDLDLQAWLCVVDPTFAFTAFASLLPDTSAKAGTSSLLPDKLATPDSQVSVLLTLIFPQ